MALNMLLITGICVYVITLLFLFFDEDFLFCIQLVMTHQKIKLVPKTGNKIISLRDNFLISQRKNIVTPQ